MKFFLAAALASTAIASPAMAGTLIGTPVTASLLYPDTATTYAGPVTSVVTGAVEFAPGAFAPAAGSIDVGANSISYFTNQNAQYSGASFNGYRLDFTGRTITSLSLNGASTLTPVSYSFSGSSVFFNLSGEQVQNGDVALFDVGVAAVPEPATWMMLIAGFAMMGYGLRKRRNHAVRVTYA